MKLWGRHWLVVFVAASLTSGCSSSSSTAAVTTNPPLTTLPLVEHLRGSSEVAVSIGDYRLGFGPGMAVTGPELIVYGNGRVYTEYFEGVTNGRPTFHFAKGQLSDEQIQVLLRAGDTLPAEAPDVQLPVDTFGTVLVTGTHSWTINDETIEPFAGYFEELRSVVRSSATTAWVPERWIVRRFPATECTVAVRPLDEPNYDAPVFPHVLDQYPLGGTPCYP